MKFIVDEMPDIGYDCPFFSRGYCHYRISQSDSSSFTCPLFDSYGDRKMGTTDDMCICLKTYTSVKYENKEN